MTWRISWWVIHDMGLVFYDMSDSMPQCVSYGKLAMGLFQTSPDCQYVWYVDFVFKVFLDRNLDNFTFWVWRLSLLHLSLLLDTVLHCAEQDKMLTDVLSSLVVEPTPSNMGTSVGKSCPPLPARCGGVSRLMVTPRVSGLERSQEKSLEQHFPEPVCSSTSSVPFSCLPSRVPASGTVPRPSPFNGNGGRHNGSPPLSKPKPFLTLPPRSHPNYNRYGDLYYILFLKQRIPSGLTLWKNCFVLYELQTWFMIQTFAFFLLRSSTPSKPPSSASAVASSSSSMRPPTPSTSVSLPYIRGSGSSGPLRPPSRASSGALFTSSPGLPPPPPLLQGPANSTAAGTVSRNSASHGFYGLLVCFSCSWEHTD